MYWTKLWTTGCRKAKRATFIVNTFGIPCSYVDHEGSKAEIRAELLNVIKEELHHVQGVPGWQTVFKDSL